MYHSCESGQQQGRRGGAASDTEARAEHRPCRARARRSATFDPPYTSLLANVKFNTAALFTAAAKSAGDDTITLGVLVAELSVLKKALRHVTSSTWISSISAGLSASL